MGKSREELIKLIHTELIMFNEEQFLSFCQIFYPQPYHNQTKGMEQNQKIRLLIEHCERQKLLNLLLKNIQNWKGRPLISHSSSIIENEQSGDLHLQAGNYHKAIEKYSIVLDLLPSANLFIKRGEIYQEHFSKPTLAISDFSSALRLLQSNETESITKVRFKRLEIMKNDKYYNAETWNEDIIWLKENLSGYSLGKILYLEAEKLDQSEHFFGEQATHAIKILNQSLQLGFNQVSIYYLRAKAHCGASNYGLALADINYILASQEKYESPLYKEFCGLKAYILLRMEKIIEAIEYCSQLDKRWLPLPYISFISEKEIEIELFGKYAMLSKYGEGVSLQNLSLIFESTILKLSKL